MEGNKIRMGGKKELMQLRGIFVQIGSFWRLLKVGGQFYNIEGFLSLLIQFPNRILGIRVVKGIINMTFFLESPTWNELLVGEQNIGVIVIVELVNGR